MKKIFVLCLYCALVFSCNTTSFSEIQAFLPDLTNKPDGVYRGNYDLSGSPVKVTVDVIIRNNNISDINIIQHFSSPIGKRAEVITESIIIEQSLDIDAISGATGSSKAILKAVENALQ